MAAVYFKLTLCLQASIANYTSYKHSPSKVLLAKRLHTYMTEDSVVKQCHQRRTITHCFVRVTASLTPLGALVTCSPLCVRQDVISACQGQRHRALQEMQHDDHSHQRVISHLPYSLQPLSLLSELLWPTCLIVYLCNLSDKCSPQARGDWSSRLAASGQRSELLKSVFEYSFNAWSTRGCCRTSLIVP